MQIQPLAIVESKSGTGYICVISSDTTCLVNDYSVTQALLSV